MSSSDTKRERANNETTFSEQAIASKAGMFWVQRSVRTWASTGRVSLIDTYINCLPRSLHVQDWFASPPHFYRTNVRRAIDNSLMLVRRPFNSHWHQPTIHCRPPPRRDQHNSSLSFTIQTCSEIFSSIFSTNIYIPYEAERATQLRGAGYWLIVMARNSVRWFSLLICFFIL